MTDDIDSDKLLVLIIRHYILRKDENAFLRLMKEEGDRDILQFFKPVVKYIQEKYHEIIDRLYIEEREIAEAVLFQFGYYLENDVTDIDLVHNFLGIEK